MARTRVQSIRSNVSGARPASQEPGTIYTNWADRQIGVADAARQPMDMVAVRYFATTASYTPGQLVVQNGKVYRATAVISPGAFDPTKWAEITVQSGSGIWVSDSPPAQAPVQGQLLWESDSGDLFVWYEDADSAQWVQINTVGGEGGNSWETRTELAAAIAGGTFAVAEGVVYVAGGYQYIGKAGATAIPDLPGLLPFGDVHVEHFGAAADLVWDIRELGLYTGSSGTTGTKGPWRVSGTDNRAKIQLANDYVTSTGAGEFFMEGGDYYSANQINLTSFMRSRGSFTNHLWARCSLLERGIYVNADNSGVTGLNIIGQYVIETSETKPYGRGDLGCVITINNIYVPVGQHRIRRNLEFDVRFCRAGYDVGVGSQRSSAAYFLFSAAGVENSKFRLGVFGESNFSSNALMICHWGGEYTGGDPVTDYFNMVISTTFHSCDNTIEFVGDIDQIARPMGFTSVLHLSGIGTTEVGDITCRGVANPLMLFPGDSCGFYANPSQKEKVMKGIRLGFVNGRDVPSPSDAVPLAMQGTGDPVSIAGIGTMPFTFDKYPGVDRQISRQIECDIVMKGASLTRGSYPPLWNGRGVYTFDVLGRIDLGAVTTYGFGRGLEVQHCHGEQVGRYIEGDGSIYLLGNRGTRILDSRVNKGDTAGTVGDGVFGPGYAIANKCAYLAGATLTTATTADAAAGATKTFITALVDTDIFVGDPVKIGPHWVVATDFISAQSTGLAGVNYILHTPLPAAVASGAAVSVDQTQRAREFVLSSSSGQFGLDATNAVIDHLDMSKFGWAGQRAVQLRSGSRANIVGLIPATVGRMDPVSANNTVSCDATSYVKVTVGTIPANPRVNATFLLSNLTGGGGTAELDACKIEDATTLLDPAMTSINKIRQLSLIDCKDFTGLLVQHPWRKGGAGGVTGYYNCMPDGQMIAWLRGQSTDAAGDFTWTFPVGFAAAATTTVTVSSANTGAELHFAAAIPTSASVVIKCWNAAGAVAIGQFNVIAAGRWLA